MTGHYNTNLPPHLRVLKDEIEAHARGYGLDFYETIFEVIDADDLNEIAAYGGFPTRYPHWSFGMQYEELSKSYSYGLSKIYEMVINNDPCYAYLMRCNHVVDQKLVMAHVYGHCDFFKNNAYFAHTTRKMMDEIANHASRIRRYVERFGEDEVEAFLDRCMSLDDLIDIHSVAIKRRDEKNKYDFTTPPEGVAEDDARTQKFKAKDYMADFINPVNRNGEEAKSDAVAVASFPDRPEKDVLLFLIEHAPLKAWQRDILSIIRDEAYYFFPQAQTKIMNEGWACLAPGSLVVTDRGMIPIDELVRTRFRGSVSDGSSRQRVTDWAEFPERETICITTRRGLVIEGSRTHQVRLADGSWKSLRDVGVGDRLEVARGADLWASTPVSLNWQPRERCTLDDVARDAGVSVWTLLRYRNGKSVRQPAVLSQANQRYESDLAELSMRQKRRAEVRIPNVVDESLALFLGMLIGDGHISAVKRVIGLTTGDASQARGFARLVRQLFGITPRIRRDGAKWRVLFSSQTIQDFLIWLGLPTGPSARVKTVPTCILQSPAGVVAAFLRGLYDCDGYAGPAGVILSTSSPLMSERVQLLLLNFGILSTRRPHRDGCWHVHTTGHSAVVFRDRIGFGLARKKERLNEYIECRRLFKTERKDDPIVRIEERRSRVFDLTVDRTHCYAAQGLVHHNSYWHSTMMTQKVLQPSELIDYADHHSGTMATSGKRLNPYKLGIELLRDVEHRWNTGQFGAEWDACEDLEAKRTWDRQLGLGRKKIFEVRRIHNDITFIDTFLTPEFCARHKLFSFGYQEPTQNYVIESREFDLVKQRLLFSLTNFGKPWIFVLNGNHRNRGELLLRHEYNGVELKLADARDTLANLQSIWSRPVHLESVRDEKPVLMSFDGTDHSITPIGGDDEPRRPTVRKP